MGASFLKQALIDLAPDRDTSCRSRPTTRPSPPRPRRSGPGTTPSARRSGARDEQFPGERAGADPVAERRRSGFRHGVRSRRGGGGGRGGAAAGSVARHDLRRRHDRQHQLRRHSLQFAAQGRGDGGRRLPARSRDAGACPGHPRARRLQRARHRRSFRRSSRSCSPICRRARRCRRAPTSPRCCSSRIRPG